MASVPKIARNAEAEPTLPLVLEAELTIDDWAAASAFANGAVIATNRRRLLTLALPGLWFFMILGAFAGWRPARSPLTLAQFIEFLTGFVGDVSFYLLLVASAVLLLCWALHPWRMHRTLTRILHASGFERPIRLRYRFEVEGLETTEPLRESFTPWSRFHRLAESREHLFLVLPAQEETIALPKRAVPADQIDTLRHWLEQHVGAPQTLPPPAEPPEQALTFEVTLEPKDRAVPVAWYQDLPQIRRSRWLGIIRNWVLASLCVPVLAIVAWSLDPYRIPVVLALPIFWALFASFFWKPALVFAALAALRLAFDRPLMRWFSSHTGAVLHQSASHRPMHFTIDESGIVTQEDGSTTHVRWDGVSSLERLPEHWLARISRGSTLIVPRRALGAEQTERFEALVRRHIGGASPAKGAG